MGAGVVGGEVAGVVGGMVGVLRVPFMYVMMAERGATRTGKEYGFPRTS